MGQRRKLIREICAWREEREAKKADSIRARLWQLEQAPRRDRAEIVVKSSRDAFISNVYGMVSIDDDRRQAHYEKQSQAEVGQRISNIHKELSKLNVGS